MQSNSFLGVDVAKAELVIADAKSPRQAIRIANRKRPIRKWLRGLPSDSVIGVESTGNFHELLVDLAHQQGVTVYLVNPRALFHYSQAVNRGRKSDPLDADLIARYLVSEYERLRPYVPPTLYERTLFRLYRQRAQVVRKKVALGQSLKELDTACRPALETALVGLQQLVEALEQRIQQLISQDAERAVLAKRLRTLPGFGPLTSAHLAALLPRLRPRSADALVGYMGLDLQPRDSGQKIGLRKLSKQGPSESRRLLYLAAQTATRTSPEWQACYADWLKKGRAPTEAINIVARRLLRIAYALYRQGTVYEAEYQRKTLASAT
jgi:transposase